MQNDGKSYYSISIYRKKSPRFIAKYHKAFMKLVYHVSTLIHVTLTKQKTSRRNHSALGYSFYQSHSQVSNRDNLRMLQLKTSWGCHPGRAFINLVHQVSSPKVIYTDKSKETYGRNHLGRAFANFVHQQSTLSHVTPIKQKILQEEIT